MLTQAQLKKILRYDSKTGEFVWRTRQGRRSDLIGKRAGIVQNKGYLSIGISGKRYLGHRLAWLYMHGCFPSGNLDHKNRNRLDNRIINLRVATGAQNAANSKRRTSNRGLLKGAFWDKHHQRWTSSIGHNGKPIYLGTFTTAEEAHAAYCKAAKRLHGEFFHAG